MDIDELALIVGEELVNTVQRADGDITYQVVLDAWQGGRFGCEEYKNKRWLPNRPGVYFVFNRILDKVVYVGKSVDIRARFAGHSHAADFRPSSDSLMVFWFGIDNIHLASTEMAYIKSLRPKFNGHAVEDNSLTSPIRTFKTDKPRLDEVQKYLTVKSGGERISQAQVIAYLLDLAKKAKGE